MPSYESEIWVRDHSEKAIVLRPAPLPPSQRAAASFQAVANEKPPTVEDLFQSNLPVTVGRVQNPGEFIRDISPGQRRSIAVSCVIKMQGTDYYLPDFLAQFALALQQVIDIEHAAHPDTQDRCCLMLVDQNVPGDGYVRIPEFHRDGSYKDLVDLSWRPTATYSTASVFPTIFSAAAPDKEQVKKTLREKFSEFAPAQGLPEIKKLVFAIADVLDRHIEDTARPEDVYQAAAFDILRSGILCPHKSPQVLDSNALRTFVSVLFVDNLGGPEFPNARRYLPFNPWLQKAMSA